MPLPDRPVSGESIATEWGTEIHDRVLAAKGTWVHGTSQSVDALEKLNLDNIDDDPGGWLDAGNDQVEVPPDAQGLYLINILFRSVNGAASGEYTRCRVNLNGSPIAFQSIENEGGTNVYFAITVLAALTAGDILECYGEVRSGSNNADILITSFRTLRLTDALGA